MANKYAETPSNRFVDEPQRYQPRAPLAQRTYGADLSYRTRMDVPAATDASFAWVHESFGLNATKTGSSVRIMPLPIYYSHGEGHSWGYAGSGPSQLALDILLDALDEWPDRKALRAGNSLAWRMHHEFKDEVIARLDQKRGWEIPGTMVETWITAWTSAHADEVVDVANYLEMDRLNALIAPFEDRLLLEGDEALTDEERAEYTRLSDELARVFTNMRAEQD